MGPAVVLGTGFDGVGTVRATLRMVCVRWAVMWAFVRESRLQNGAGLLRCWAEDGEWLTLMRA